MREGHLKKEFKFNKKKKQRLVIREGAQRTDGPGDAEHAVQVAILVNHATGRPHPLGLIRVARPMILCQHDLLARLAEHHPTIADIGDVERLTSPTRPQIHTHTQTHAYVNSYLHRQLHPQIQ